MTSKATPSLTSKATPSLPSLHAALSAPLARKYSRAQSWRPSGSATAGPTRVELSFSEPDMVDSKPSAHAVYYDLVTDGSGLSLAAPPRSFARSRSSNAANTCGQIARRLR